MMQLCPTFRSRKSQKISTSAIKPGQKSGNGSNERYKQAWATPRADALFASAEVELARKPGCPLGLGIAGGIDCTGSPVVSTLRPGSIAHRSDGLSVGDRIKSVNGINVSDLTHHEILSLLRNADDDLVLGIEYDVSLVRKQRPTNVKCRTADITLDKDGQSFGFLLRGGSWGPCSEKSRPLTIVQLRVGGSADREGRIRPGDRLVAIDAMDVTSATWTKAMQLIQESRDPATLTIEYDVLLRPESEKWNKKSREPRVIEISKNPGSDLGLVLKCSNVPEAFAVAISIESISPASVADRCGSLFVGDVILSINGTSLEYTTLAEAYQLLRNPNGTRILLDVVPSGSCLDPFGSFTEVIPRKVLVKSNSINSSDEVGVKKAGSKNNAKKAKSSASEKRSRYYQPAEINNNTIVEKPNGKKQPKKQKSRSSRSDRKSLVSQVSSSSTHKPSSPLKRHVTSSATSGYCSDTAAVSFAFGGCMYRQYSRRKSFGGRGSVTTSSSGIPCSQVCHSEVVEVYLSSCNRGAYGIALHRPPTYMEHNSPLILSYIERGSPADRSGVLHVGDRVLAINDWYTSGATAGEATQKIKQSPHAIKLTIEFNVIETVLPSSGVYTVKLARRGDCLGIVITSPPSTSGLLMAGQKGEPVIVSEVRTGSIAHRCGSIHAGDQILSIDNIPLETCTVEEAARLLQRSSDIVKLRICKGSPFSESDTDSSLQTVVYSVELSRKNGPLGITVAGTENQYDPIFVSQLAPGGLADRTGALHVGDRILAINSESLSDKRVSEAIQLLKKSGESVTLRIGRTVEPKSYQHPETYSERDSSEKLGTPVQSIDSAVESLEDYPDSGCQGSSVSGVPVSGRSFKAYMEDNDMRDPSGTKKYGLLPDDLSLELGKSLVLSKDENYPADSNSIASLNESSGGCDSASSPKPIFGGHDWGFSKPGCQANNYHHEEQQEDWFRVLKSLETVGEAEMLRKIEESILKGTVPLPSSSEALANERPSTSLLSIGKDYSMTNTILKHPYSSSNKASCHQSQQSHGILSTSATGSCKQSEAETSNSALKVPKNSGSATPKQIPVPAGNSQITSSPCPRATSFLNMSMDASSIQVPPEDTSGLLSGQIWKVPRNESHSSTDSETATLPPPQGELLSTNLLASAKTTPRRSDPSPLQPVISSRPLNAEVSSFNPPSLPLEIYRVSLEKDSTYNDFGFSVSEGMSHQGVYINKIRTGGPADLAGTTIKPLDRILQVNTTSVREVDCKLVAALLQSAGDRIELLICRDLSVNVSLVANGNVCPQRERYAHVEVNEHCPSISPTGRPGEVKHTEV